MIRRSLGLACLLSAIALAGPVSAQGTPRSVGECERLKNDLAYNQCLAMFGPAAKNVGGGDGGSGPAPSASVVSAEAAAVAGIPTVNEPEILASRRARHSRYGRRGGRQSMSFALASSGDDGIDGTSSGSSRRRHRRRY